ncbi:MAG: LuxR C-terminal-related transcriptional regulator [Coxiellaceae bacterium]|nr:LuxR C-terminal-related transcriptional regulator [Coxiellaceae bacterium]
MTFSRFKNPKLKSNTKKSHWDDVLNDLVYKKLFKSKASINKPLSVAKRFPLKEPYQGEYLTTKQRLILIAFLQEKTSKCIAGENNLSERTVEDYSKILREKFNCVNRRELVKKLNTTAFIKQLLDMQ